MNYQDTLAYLYESAPMFQQIGKAAYKEGLSNTYALDDFFGHPHRQFKTIHVAGTNGKGSCSHTLAAIFQSAGYKTGLYTSPHLTDFRERIRINGETVPQEFVISFVDKYRSFFEPLYPSFFELTTAMAFKYFAEQQVDIAIIEVGMGGRLDCTNIITPEIGIITNISLDHTQFLGDTPEKIAREKAGIIKRNIPIIIGETTPETKPVFISKAQEVNAPIIFAEEEKPLLSAKKSESGQWIYKTKDDPDLIGELGGVYQLRNTNTLLSAIHQLIRQGFNISEADIRKGFANVTELTGLTGRWQKLGERPTLICDTGHNIGGMTYIVEQLKDQTYRRLHFVIGMVNDKDINGVLALLPKNATYYFTRASVKRALPEQEMKELATKAGLEGECYPSVPQALEAAKREAGEGDFIFVGGSSFIVADLLQSYPKQ